MKHKVFRNIVLVSLGKSVSLLGSSVYTFAMGLYVLRMTGSGLTFAVTLVLGILPVILINPLAGVLADRGNKKLIVIMADLLNGSILFGLVLLSLFNEIGLLAIYISTLVLNIVTVMFDINLEASIPDIVPRDSLMSMNSASKAIESAASVIGPMLGGAVYIFLDIRTFICANAISFFFSAIMECCIDFKLSIHMDSGYKIDDAANDKSHTGSSAINGDKSTVNQHIIGVIKDIGNGIDYMKGNREISGAFFFLTGLNFFIGFSVLVPLPYILNSVLHLGPVNYGIIQASFPAGALLGALLIKRWNPESGYMKILFKAAFVLAFSIIFIALPVLLGGAGMLKTFQTACYCAIMGVMGFSAASVDIPLLYLLQIRIAANIRGRVLSLGMSMVKTASPLAFLLSGVLLDYLPGFLLVLAGGALLLIYTCGCRNWLAAAD